MKMFDVLKGSTTLSEVDYVDLSDEHILYCEDVTKHWKQASHWVEWWTRLPHLKMLCEAFSEAAVGLFRMAPKDTNGVEE